MAPVRLEVSLAARTKLSWVDENSTIVINSSIVIKRKVDFFAHPALSKWRSSLRMLQPRVVARHRQRLFSQAASSRMWLITVMGGAWVRCSLQCYLPIQRGVGLESSFLIH